jgi:hypothetical protein
MRSNVFEMHGMLFLVRLVLCTSKTLVSTKKACSQQREQAFLHAYRPALVKEPRSGNSKPALTRLALRIPALAI